MNASSKPPQMHKYYTNIVRIIAHETGFDWMLPFQKLKSNKSFGSGFFIDKKGHILTCAHCVESASHVFIEIPSEGDKQYVAEIKGVCPFFDLAIVKIQDYKNESFCKLDNGDTRIEPGFETYALGYPLGQENMKITKGIISGQQFNMYQTDTAINPGNSGGPLLYNDKVIGINAAGMPAFAADGIGFAVPIQRYYTIKNLLFKNKHLILYPQYFGFEMMQNTSEDFQRYLKNKCKSGGVYVNKLIPKSPVTKTKLKAGDVLCAINDIHIDYYGGILKKWMNENMSFENILMNTGIKNNVSIKYWNGKEIVHENFTLNHFNPTIRLYYPIFEQIDYECIGGMIIMNLNINLVMILNQHHLMKYLDLDHIMEEKVVIANILVGGYLTKLNIIHKGDIIHKINNKKIKNLKDVRKHFHANKNYLRIETSNNKIAIIPLKVLEKDDKNLRKTYMYKKSNLFKHV